MYVEPEDPGILSQECKKGIQKPWACFKTILLYSVEGSKPGIGMVGYEHSFWL